MTVKRTVVHLPKPKGTASATLTEINSLSSHSRSTLSNSSISPPTSVSFSAALSTPGTTYNKQYHNNNGGTNAEPHQMQHYNQQTKSYDIALFGGQFLVSDTLYFEVPQSITDNDMYTLLASCRPLLMQRNKYQDQYQDHVATGWIRFVNKEQADRAYTLFDGLILKNSHRLQLYITPEGTMDQVPNAPIFQISHLPLSMSNECLYNLFRPFGPIRVCKVIVEKDSSSDGTALLQYFNQEHAENAMMVMNNKYIDGKSLSIFSLVSNKPDQSSPTNKIHQIVNKSDPKTAVDYTNLYIKNLDLAAKSADLYNVFCAYGHIISARVMKNPRSKQSRGYGFVSFTHPDEAKAALNHFNGKYILSKPVIIAYHEPKRLATSPSSSFLTPATPNPTTSAQPQQQKRTVLSPPLSLGNNFAKNGKDDHRYYHAATPATPIASTPSSSSSPSLSSLDKNGSEHPGCSHTPQLQRARIRAAIMKVISKDKDISQLDTWVEHIMSLRSISRALCLFNPTYLLSKLNEVMMTQQHADKPLQQYNHTPKTPNLIQANDHHSHASSSTTISSAAITSTTDMVHMQDIEKQEQHYSIARFVESIKGLSLIQQKQQLGDMLFPYVKATGIKQASKVTIKLLDTQPLDQLAYSMHSTELLKPLVDKAFMTLTRQQK
ncbi:unnamed protein product [Absidia cylindrospora]